jgi:hypothetical protein
LPSQIGTTGVLAVALTSSEMTADTVTVLFHDASGAEWQDLLLVIHTAARLVDDLAFPTTSGRSIDVDADGGVEVDSLQDGAITANAIASGAITDAKLADGAIAAAKIASGAANKIADHVLRRSWASAASSADGDTKAFRSLLGAVAKLVNKLAVSNDTLTIYEANDSTALGTQTVTSSADAEVITGLDTD